MPRRPPTVCAHPGCGQLVQGGRCSRHRRIQKELRASSSQRGYGPEWRKYRRDYLRAAPWCVQCRREGRQTRALVVDHIQPVGGPLDPTFWDPRNHQALCPSCHSKKTAAEDGGFGNMKRGTAHG
jgi:5-methylcytosine-specific restriction protein A